MNLQQLRIIREAVRHDFNLTEAANALFTSQSGVSKHIKELEEELGVDIFLRRGKRLLGLTDPGRELVVMVERLLLEASNIKRLAEHYTRRDTGELTIVTTHTQARYALPRVIAAFKQEFPKVHLRLHQGSPGEILQMLIDGEADVGVATEALAESDELVSIPFYTWHHAIVVPRGHPLEAFEHLALRDIASHPVVTYHRGFTGRARVDEAFARAGLAPDIVMSALDADVIKTYVELGHGVGIIASMAFDAHRDSQLRLLPSEHLFALNTTHVSVRRHHYLRGYGHRFVQLCLPEMPSELLASLLAGETDDPASSRLPLPARP